MVAARDWFGDGSLYVVDVPLACCALETQAATGERTGVPLEDIPEGAGVVVTLSGTITGPMLPSISAVLGAVPERSRVVAFGACACAGGPYWDSYAVVRGAGAVVPVDHFIAGCPPPPSVLDDFLATERAGAEHEPV